MSLVENDQVPSAVLEENALVFGPLKALQRRDCLRLKIPHPRIDRQEVPAEDLEQGSKLLFHFLLPLLRQAGRSDDQGAFGLPALMERLPDHAGLDGLAQTDLVGKQEP